MPDAKWLEQRMADATVTTQSEIPLESDEALLTRFLTHRDQEAFSQLVQRYQNFAFRVAYCHCSNNALAQEAVQDAFFQLARPGCRFESSGAGSFKVWFYTVVSNVARNTSRVERRTMERVRSRRYQDEQEQHSASESATAWKDDNAGALKSALDTLKEELRLPIVLHFLEGMDQGEISRMAGVSRSLISRRITEGLELLRKRLLQSGISLSLSALPELLKSSQLLQAPASLQGALTNLSAASVTAASSRGTIVSGNASPQAMAARLISGWGVAALGVALAAGIGYWQMQSKPETTGTPAPAPEALHPESAAPKSVQPSPLAPVPAIADPAIKSFSWDFNQAFPWDAFKRPAVPLQGVPDWPLPEWVQGLGKDGTGALKFGAQGASLFIATGLPTAQLPIRLEFELLALDPAQCQFGVAAKIWGKFYPAAEVKVTGNPRRKTWDTLHWQPWLRQIQEQPEGIVISSQWYGEEAIGEWSEEPKGTIWPDPGRLVYFELHGQNALIDNLRLRYGKGLETTHP